MTVMVILTWIMITVVMMKIMSTILVVLTVTKW